MIFAIGRYSTRNILQKHRRKTTWPRYSRPVFVNIFKSIKTEHFGPFKVRLSGQELLNEHRISSVQQFWSFDPNDGGHWPFGGPGVPNLKFKSLFLVSMFLAWQVTLYLLASLHAERGKTYSWIMRRLRIRCFFSWVMSWFESKNRDAFWVMSRSESIHGNPFESWVDSQ